MITPSSQRGRLTNVLIEVMPSALLQQTKEILRQRFASLIMPKRVFTLEFERSVEDSADFVVVKVLQNGV